MIGWVAIWAYLRTHRRWRDLANRAGLEGDREALQEALRARRQADRLLEHMNDADMEEAMARILTGWERDDDPRGCPY